MRKPNIRRPDSKIAEPLSIPGSPDTRPDDRAAETLEPENRKLVRQGLDAVRSGDVAGEDEIPAILDRYRL